MQTARDVASYLGALIKKTITLVLLVVDLVVLVLVLFVPSFALPVWLLGVIAVAAFLIGGFQVGQDMRRDLVAKIAEEESRHEKQLKAIREEKDHSELAQAIRSVAESRLESDAGVLGSQDPTPRFRWEPQVGMEYSFRQHSEPSIWALMQRVKGQEPSADVLPGFELQVFGTVHNDGATDFEIIDISGWMSGEDLPVRFGTTKFRETLPIRVEPGERDLEVVLEVELRPGSQSEEQFAARMRAVRSDATSVFSFTITVVGPNGTIGRVVVERSVVLRPLFKAVGALWKENNAPFLPTGAWWA